MKTDLKTLLPAVLTLGVAAQADAQLSVFLQVPDVKGGSVEVKHKEWIEVLSWGWGVSNSTSVDASGVLPGDPLPQQITVVKPFDVASVSLYKFIATGVIKGKSTIEVVDTSGCGGLIQKVTMAHTLVTSNSVGAATAQDTLPVESMTFAYDKICVSNITYDDLCWVQNQNFVSYDVVADTTDAGSGVCP